MVKTGRNRIGIALLYHCPRDNKKNYFFLYMVDILTIISAEMMIPVTGVNTDKGTRGVKEVLGTTV